MKVELLFALRLAVPAGAHPSPALPLPALSLSLQRWKVALAGCALLCALFHAPGAEPANLITNGGFERGFAGWRPLWTRTAEAGTASLELQDSHTGRQASRIEHRGGQD